MKLDMELANIALLLASNRGTYIPQHFAEGFDMAAWRVSEDDAAILRAGHDADGYWETWDHVLDTAYFLADDGRRFTLWQDGDLWSVCADSLSNDEYRNFFGEERE